VELAHRWSDRNLSRVELVTAILMLAIFIGSFSKYTFDVFAKIERSMVERTVININTALHYRASMMAMQGQYEELQLLLKLNPMEELVSMLEIKDIKNNTDAISIAYSGSVISMPSNYGGAMIAEDMADMEKGKWYFRTDNHVLLYMPDNITYISNNNGKTDGIRFRIKLDYKDNNKNGRYDHSDEFNSIKLELLDNIEL